MREKIQELEKKIVEGSLKDDLLASKDTHIEDLQNTISHLQNSNSDLNQNLKKFIKEEFSKIDSNFSKLQLYNNLTIADYAAQIKSKDSALENCELKLNETENKTNITISENLKIISQLETKVKSMEAIFDQQRDELVKHREIIQELQGEIYNLLKEEKDGGENLTSCTTYGDSNDIHEVQLSHSESFPALCNSEIAGPGWIVIQQRINGIENFQRDWESYKNGFGNFSGDFFLGLEKIHRLTYNQPHELYIHMERYNGGTFFARYDSFQIGSEDSHYQLSNLGSYSGNAEFDRMRYSEGENFSTFDNDNDNNLDNCAVHSNAGWWFHSCANW